MAVRWLASSEMLDTGLVDSTLHAAQSRREHELMQLVREGLRLRRLGKTGHWILSFLHIYTASGRWLNTKTGHHGRLGQTQIRTLVEREYSAQIVEPGGGPETSGSVSNSYNESI